MRFLIVALILCAQAAGAQTLAVQAGRVHTAAEAGVIEDAVILIKDGKFTAVGPASSVAIPADAEVLAAAVVLPGLIDARSTIGLSGWLNIPADRDQDETSDPVTPALRALDALNPAEPLLAFVREFGVTTVQTGPGDANVIAGQTGVFKTWGETADAMALRPQAAMIFNLAEGPRSQYGAANKAPGTRMASAAMIRQQLVRAQAPAKEDDAGSDLGLAALRKVIAGDLRALFVAHRASDIQTALRLIDEFKLDGQIVYGTEAYLVTAGLQRAGMPVLLGPTAQRIGSMETMNTRLDNAAMLAAAGVDFSFGTGHEAYAPKTYVLLHELTLAVAHGLDADRAVRAATADAARLLGVDQRVGAIRPGLDADLVLFDGEPFEFTTHVTGVVIDGRIISRAKR
jgi:imidazolonepropionase-like amidohydrolase